MTPEKLKASQEYAESKGMKPLKHHLLPRPKGFSVTVNALKDSGRLGTLTYCLGELFLQIFNVANFFINFMTEYMLVD